MRKEMMILERKCLNMEKSYWRVEWHKVID